MDLPERPPWRRPGGKLTLDRCDGPARKLEMPLPERPFWRRPSAKLTPSHGIEWGRKNNPNIQGCSALSK